MTRRYINGPQTTPINTLTEEAEGCFWGWFWGLGAHLLSANFANVILLVGFGGALGSYEGPHKNGESNILWLVTFPTCHTNRINVPEYYYPKNIVQDGGRGRKE